MRFWSRRNNDYTDQFDAPLSGSEKLSWIQNATQKNLLTQWGETLLRVEELFSEPILYYPENQPEMLRTLTNLKHEWMKIDRRLVTESEAQILYDIMHKELPALIYRLSMLKSTRDSVSQNHEDNHLSLRKKMDQLSSDIFRVRAVVDAQKLARFKELNPGESNVHLSKLNWPSYDAVPSDVQQKLEEIRSLWEAQKGKVLTVEDEYLLERIVTDYIPSSLGLYNPFISDKMELETTARQALLSQLDIIQGHLERMSERSFEEQMKTLNAQTKFLKDRFMD